jgi:hypothetical protein
MLIQNNGGKRHRQQIDDLLAMFHVIEKRENYVHAAFE